MSECHNLTYAEEFAISQIVSEWESHYTYDQVLNSIERNDGDVYVWCVFEDQPADVVVDAIESARVSFLRTAEAMTAELRQAIKDGDPMTIAEKLASFENQLGVTQ